VLKGVEAPHVASLDVEVLVRSVEPHKEIPAMRWEEMGGEEMGGEGRRGEERR
jgi:hypothetical protein